MNHLVLATALNLREKPTTDSGKKGLLPRFFTISEVSATTDRAWIQTQFNGSEGWLSNRYLLREEAYKAAPWVPVAASEFGIAEVLGTRSGENNPRIQAYLAQVGKDPETVNDEVAWCAGFVKWCLTQTGVSAINLKNINASARSWKSFGKDVTNAPRLGSIVVLWRRDDAKGDAGRTAIQVEKDGKFGHVGFLVEPYQKGDAGITLLGGNQGNQVSKKTYAFGNDYGLLTIRN